MSLTLDLPLELESELSAEASRMGLSLSEYVTRMLLAGRPPATMPRTGSELVSYWLAEGLAGSRADIADSQAHSRVLRQRAEQRERS